MRSYHYIEETDSTNLELWRMIKRGALPPEGSIVWAGNQTRGRGQAETHWESEANKNLTFSILLMPAFLPPSKQFILNKTVALGIRDALATLCKQFPFFIKWPNDIYADKGKIAGTLIENRISGRSYELCVAGIGININQTTFPEDIPNPVSLTRLTGEVHDLSACIKVVEEHLMKRYTQLKQGNEATIDQEYLEHLLGYQQQMRFSTDQETFTATVSGISEYGQLLLTLPDGTQQAFGMKEISMNL